MKVLITTIGSRGDVQPMVVLGRALERRGHSVCIAAPPNFQAFIEERGLAFLSAGADTEAIILENRETTERSPIGSIPKLIGILRRETERQIRDVLAYPGEVDLVVAAGLAFGGHALAERHQAPYVYVSYTLHGVLDDAHPPAVAPLFGLPRLGNRALWASIIRLFDSALGGAFNRARTSHGLPPTRTPWRDVHASRVLLAQDALLGELSTSAARFTAQVPALVERASPEGPALPPPVETFLARAATERTPVTYIGFGSMPSVDRVRVQRAVLEFQRRTGTRVLLFSARDEEKNAELPPEILPIGGLDHARLFPRVDFIVHHGGAGTTATALRSGAPQLIVPHVLDQYFHGSRVAALGLGPKPIPKAKLDARGLIDAYRVSRACVQEARRVQTSLEGTAGPDAAVDYLEALSRA